MNSKAYEVMNNEWKKIDIYSIDDILNAENREETYYLVFSKQIDKKDILGIEKGEYYPYEEFIGATKTLEEAKYIFNSSVTMRENNIVKAEIGIINSLDRNMLEEIRSTDDYEVLQDKIFSEVFDIGFSYLDTTYNTDILLRASEEYLKKGSHLCSNAKSIVEDVLKDVREDIYWQLLYEIDKGNEFFLEKTAQNYDKNKEKVLEGLKKSNLEKAIDDGMINLDYQTCYYVFHKNLNEALVENIKNGEIRSKYDVDYIFDEAILKSCKTEDILKISIKDYSLTMIDEEILNNKEISVLKKVDRNTVFSLSEEVNDMTKELFSKVREYNYEGLKNKEKIKEI